MKLRHAERYRKLASLLTRYGLKDFRLDTSSRPAIQHPSEDASLEPNIAERAEAFARELKQMGPSFVKFGQVLSTRRDVVPEEYLVALESFQDDVAPFSFGDVERIIETELGAKISKLFAELDHRPIAAASLGQVHPGILRDGRWVMVKVQRPNVREQIEEDLEIFHEIAGFIEDHSALGHRLNLAGAVREYDRTIRNELDYRQEARHAVALRQNLADFPEIYVPGVVADLTTPRVLTMEMVEGTKISELSGLAKTEHDYSHLSEILTKAYIKQICVDGFWHSDPHPGNLFVHEGSLILLDFGMVSQISGEFQDHVVRLLLNLSDNRGEQIAETLLRMGTPHEGFVRRDYIEEITNVISLYQGIDFHRINTGQMVFQMISAAATNHVRLPSELSMLAKTLLHLDSVTRELDPGFDPQECIRDYAEELVVRKLRQRFKPRNFYTALLDANYLVTEVPGRIRSILEDVTTGKFALRIRLSDLEDLLKGVHKIANRITVGLVVAALLISSALMMRVQGGFTLAGYNGFSVLGFVVAIIASGWLIIQTFYQDRKDRKTAAREKVI
ncbi:MAG: AarF/UbiB family protein [Thermoanaerobaculia bacterium]|nr:AarF/UbiB family protein [Thermoanaerobaculia bacterium]